jgi:hypothetical protein
MKLHAQALVPASDPSTLGETVARELASEWGAAATSIRTAGASCEIHAWPEGLRLDAYADSEPELMACERALNDVVTKTGASPVDWQIRPSTVPGAPPPTMPVYNFPADDEDE